MQYDDVSNWFDAIMYERVRKMMKNATKACNYENGGMFDVDDCDDDCDET